TLEGGAHDLLVEVGRDIDAAVGDAVVVRLRRSQALGALLGLHASGGRMDRDGGVVVDPQHASSIDRGAIATDKAAGRRRTVPARNLAKCEAGNPRCHMVTNGRTKQARGRATQLPV